MKAPFGIEINFNPFNITFFDDNETPDIDLKNLSDLDFFSLPDILYESNSRRFLGLSFSINHGGESVARRFCLKSNNVKVIDQTDEEYGERYIGFKTSSRLEVVWMESNSIECEPASLSDGYWLGLDSMNPNVYRLLNIPDLIADHSMIW